MRLVLSIIFVFISLLAYSQQDTVFVRYNQDPFEEQLSYKTDTIIFNSPFARHILQGTTVLPWTYQQQVAKYYGLYLENVTSEPCRNEGEEPQRFDEIVSISKSENKLDISVKISGNCCHSFLCDIDVVNDKTINLITHGYGSYCACICCFGITFHFDVIENDEYAKLESVIINGKEETRRKFR